MAAAGLGNPLGYVPVGDTGNPMIISGRARAEAISGGVFVFASGADGVVGSGLSSFVNSDLLFARDASGSRFNGICLQSVGSNEPIAVVRNADILLAANGAVLAGAAVGCDGNNAVAPIGSTTEVLADGASKMIGRALTGAASGTANYALIHIRG